MNTYIKLVFLCLPLLLTACGSSRRATENATNASKAILATTELMTAMENQQTPQFMTAKMKFNLHTKDQDVSVGGNLKMKRDDVIQLSLVAFGIIEAGRMEFTQDEVLIVDRINKRYLRCPYSELSFLADAELNFYSLQALFRNELFVPGKQTVKGNERLLTLQQDGLNKATLRYANQQLSFNFLVDMGSALIQQVQVTDAQKRSTTQFAWQYADLENWNGRMFPLQQTIALQGDNQVEVTINLSNLSSNSNWEPRTSIRGGYTQMDVQDVLKLLLKLN